MNIERLKRLEALLRRVHVKPAKHRQFDMNHWFETQVDEVNHTVKIDARGNCKIVVEKPECGTSACALGHAALDPVFQKAGLKMDYNDAGSGTPNFRGHGGMDAGMLFFELDLTQAMYLFNGSDLTAQQVANRVKDVYEGRV